MFLILPVWEIIQGGIHNIHTSKAKVNACDYSEYHHIQTIGKNYMKYQFNKIEMLMIPLIWMLKPCSGLLGSSFLFLPYSFLSCYDIFFLFHFFGQTFPFFLFLPNIFFHFFPLKCFCRAKQFSFFSFSNIYHPLPPPRPATYLGGILWTNNMK